MKATITDAVTRMIAQVCPIHRRRKRVTRATATAESSVAATTARTVSADAGVPSRAYFTEVR